MDVVTQAPKVPLTHFRKAMEADPTSSVYSTINFGEKAESGGFIKLKSKLKQSREFREHLEQVPLAIECEKQMSTGNYILPACRNVTARANFLDKYSIAVEYNGVPDVFQNLTYQVFSALREMAYTQVSENVMVCGNKEGQINLDASFSPDLSRANLSIDTSRLNVAFTNLQMGKWSRAIAVFHPEYNMVQRLGQITMRSQQYPTCAMDKSFATTFDNKTYPITLGKCWHVMVQSTPYYRNGFTDEYLSPNNSARFSILVRDIVAGQREVMLILDENVVTLLPTAGSTADHYLVNGQKHTIYKDSTTHYMDKEGHTVVKAYKLPSGSLRVLTPMHGFEIIYDGLRVKLQIPNGYRNKVHGLCGNFDGEKSTDFMTPQNCILQNPREFSSTYAIADQSCEAPAVLHLRQRAQTAICHNKTVAPGDVISNLEAGRRLHKSSPIMKSSKVIDGTRNKVKQPNGQETCGVYATLIIHRAGFKCFSKTPQLQCLGACQKPVTRVTKQIEFFCLSEPAGKLINSLSDVPKTLQPTLIPRLEGVWVPLQCE